MLIYKDTFSQFIQDSRDNRLTDIMSESFSFRFGHPPNESEYNSWQNSLSRVSDLIEKAGLIDNIIALEYEVPYNQMRIDCLLFGKDDQANDNIVLIELKQWTKATPLEDQGNFHEVETVTGNRNRIVAHPSQQVEGYTNYIKSFVSEFEKQPPMILFGCSYCHNYTKIENIGLFDPVYKKLLSDFPVYTKKDLNDLASKIKQLLSKGDGFEIFNRFMQSSLRPSKKLLENVHKIISNEESFSLLNEQLVAKNLIWSRVNKAKKLNEKSVIIVHGGPGTGKSVIALNILAEGAIKNKKIFYGCKSKPFIEGLKNLIGKEGQVLFSNLYRFLPTRIKENELDIVLIDEAHRIEKKSNFQFTKPDDRTDMPQVEQLVRCARTSVFFIDDKQSVRSQEIGNSEIIREAALKYNSKIYEVQLETQYRCMGSNNYLLWLESVFGYSTEKRFLAENEVFDFQILDTPQQVQDLILEREAKKSNSARMVAGFCWPWSKKLDKNGEFIRDIVIGDYKMPWETHGEIKPPKGYVKWYEWAYKAEGVKQVGCIYTAQGFEFDYVGVIVGNDLAYDYQNDRLTADKSQTKDPTLKRSKDKFEEHVKNIYRVLMTRGMKGCYVYFENSQTKEYFQSRLGRSNKSIS